MARSFYECPKCGFFHPSGFNGTCDDTENRYDMDQLEEDYPDWREVDPPLAVAEVIENPNQQRLLALRPDVDLNGNKLEVGCQVRVYTTAHFIPATDTLANIALGESRHGVVDGLLEQVDFHYSTETEGLAAAFTAAADALAQSEPTPRTSAAYDMEYFINRASGRDPQRREAMRIVLSQATTPETPYLWAVKQSRDKVLSLLRECAVKCDKNAVITDPTPYYVVRGGENNGTTIRTVVNGHPVHRCTNADHIYLPDEFCPSFIVFRM